VNRRPHTATLLWIRPGTYGTNNRYHEGATSSLVINCVIKPNASHLVRDANGDLIKYDHEVVTDRMTQSIPSTATMKLDFFNKKHLVLEKFDFQYHTRFRVCEAG